MISSSQLENISRQFFISWRIWRLDQGWTLGPDVPDSKMSPYLVRNYDGLEDHGKQWFRQHAALVLHSAQSFEADLVTPSENSDRNQVAIKKLQEGMTALDGLQQDIARRKFRTALRLLLGLPIRPRVEDD